MKYGESAFIILYLLLAIGCGLRLLRRAGSTKTRLMGVSALVLGLGDAFHLVPRVLDHFIDSDFTAALGIGKLVTSVTMTAFYLLLYYIWLRHYRAAEDKRLTRALWALMALRVILCLFPQNGWLRGGSGMAWAVIRNAPFVIIGAAVCAVYYKMRNEKHGLGRVWLYILFSFAFYIPVAVGAGKIPMLGMLMVPKTVCYILMLISFLRCEEDAEQGPRRGAPPVA